MAFRFFKTLIMRNKLKANLRDLEHEKKRLVQHLNKTKTNDRNNIRQSDRKFKENNNKALSARIKRANKADIQRLNKQIKTTKRQLNDINSLFGNYPLWRLTKRLSTAAQSFVKFFKS